MPSAIAARPVGKFWFATDRRTEAMPWEWHLSIPMTLPDDTKGVAAGKAQALQAMANALHTLLLRTPADRIERAFQLSAATGLGFGIGEQIELDVEEIVAPVAIPESPPAAAAAAAVEPAPIDTAPG